MTTDTTDFKYKIEPFYHQRDVFEKTWDRKYYGLFMEQRTGKSAVILYTAAQLFKTGRINSLFIIAPAGVHRNWVSDEVEKHLPNWVDRQTLVWSSNKKIAEMDKIFSVGDHLRILTMNFEALSTKKGMDFATRFMNATNCLLVIDESTRIKNPRAKSVKNILKLRDLAKYRRICNGTPVTNSPFDLFSQLMFLHDDALPVSSEKAFKQRYADFLHSSHPLVRSIMRKSGTRWAPQIAAKNADGTTAYKNLDDLKMWVDKNCYRITRKECADLPEKLYKRWEVELSSHQNKLIIKYLDAINKGETPEPINKMTGVMLYQRMICGIVPKQLTGLDEHQKMFVKPEENPRIQAVLEIIDSYHDASIIFWARFKTDLHDISNAITSATGLPVARYWGDISSDEREKAKDDFQAKRVKYFVGQQSAGGVGLPLHSADVMVYYSNTFSLYHRAQSEDRSEHMQKTTSTLIIDIEAKDTVDTKIIDALRKKRDVADMITGDEKINWLEHGRRS